MGDSTPVRGATSAQHAAEAVGRAMAQRDSLAGTLESAKQVLGFGKSERELVQDLHEAIEETRDRVETAQRVASTFGDGDWRALKKLKRYQDALEDLAKPFEAASEVANAADVAGEIVDLAVAVESIPDAEELFSDPAKREQAALAYGEVFYAAGVLAERLPPPWDAWASFLKGARTFFDDMRHGLDPALKPGFRRGRDVLREEGRQQGRTFM